MLPRTGVCVLSIPLFAGDSSPGLRASEPLAADLSAQLAAADVPATWTYTITQLARMSEALSNQLAPGELALLAPRAWAGGHANRGQFATGLASSLSEAEKLRLRPTTLVFEQRPATLHDDLLAKTGISVVCFPGPSRTSAPSARQARQALPSGGCLRALRWGLWELDGAIDLAEAGWRRAVKAIDRAAREGGEAAISIDLKKWSGGLKPIGRLLGHLAGLRAEQRLTIQTIADLAASRATSRQAPARSILRIAA